MNRLVDIYIASLWRQGHVVKTVKSLLLNPEVGSITISCNNYTDDQWLFVNDMLSDSKITLHRTNNEKCSNEKLRFAGTGNNYYVCFADDDLIYPPDYLSILISKCEEYNAMVSMHGRILLKKGLTSYYRQALTVLQYSNNVDKDTEVDIAGNGCSLFKRNFFDDIDTWYNFCNEISMDDIYVNYFAHKKGIKRFVIAHKKGYLNHKEKSPEDNYVYDQYKHDDKIQTDFYNEHFNSNF